MSVRRRSASTGSSSTARPSRAPRPRELVEPATGEPLARVQLAGEADIDRAVDAARAALDGDWGKTRRPSARACCTRSPTRSSRTAPS